NQASKFQPKPTVQFSGRTDEPQEDIPAWLVDLRFKTLIEQHFAEKDPKAVRAAFEEEMSGANITTNSGKIDYLTEMEAALDAEQNENSDEFLDSLTSGEDGDLLNLFA